MNYHEKLTIKITNNSSYLWNMMINLKILWIFYGKLLIPTVLFSILLLFQTGFSTRNFGVCFFVFLPLLHFFIYELRLKNEYSFYANFGFSKLFLWILTLTIAIIINLITMLL